MNLPKQISPVQRNYARTFRLEEIQASADLECTICRAACTLLSPVKRVICEAACNLTFCKKKV